MPRRLPDWEARLSDWLAAQRGRPFEWGRNDCVLFAAGAVQAMTGRDPAADVRGTWSTRIGALRALKEQSARGVADVVWFEEIEPAHAMRGDLVLARQSLGVCIGRVAMFVGEDGGEAGPVPLPRAEWARAWRVPFGA